MKKISRILPVAFMSMLSFQTMAELPNSILFDADGIQIAVAGFAERASLLARDGSSCDPSVIRENLKKVNQSEIFQGINLTKTITKASCYGPCPGEVIEAKELHCLKGELLAQLVEKISEHKK